ncbi:MAG TPA: HD-GYP domain-containing protein [Terriglobia bacterium]|nr:HD-GYP domain-containing protein [Terriglobia bacterium]
MMNTSPRGDPEYRIAQLEDRARDQTLAMACSLVSLVDLRDRYTGGHSARVASYVRDTAVRLCLPDEETENIVLAASLHDIGKIGVPDQILLEPGKLTEEQFACIRKHSEWGWMAVRNVDGFHQAALLILHHHERLDGKGYPSRLRGTEIPLGARLIAVADTFDALTTNRPYRAAYTLDIALNELQRCAGKQLDPDVVEAFCASIENKSDEKLVVRSA